MGDTDRLAEVRIEIVGAMNDLIAHAEDTVWMTCRETVFERLVYLFEVAGGQRATLMERWPEYFD